MRTSENGIAFIKGNEGFVAFPKMDVGGRMVWGYGHDQRLGESLPSAVSEAQADATLRADLPAYYEPHVAALAPWATQNQFDALVDFCYNLGPEALATMLHHGQAAVSTQMAAWCYEHVNGAVVKSQGLAARRAKEIALYGA